MKQFLLKAALYVVILLVIVLTVSFYFFRKIPPYIALVSNSVSYNLKAGFVRQHPEKLGNSRLVVVGSSLTLNNINTKMLEDTLHLPAINLASWGLRIANYQYSPIWDQPRIFLCNLGVTDFGAPMIELRDNFSFNTSRLREFFNLCTDFNTTMDEVKQAKTIRQISDNRDFKSCNFDDYGSVLLSDSAFNFDSTRWNEDDYVRFRVDSASLIDYVQRLKKLTSSHHGYDRIIISFSPGRRMFYSRNRSEMVAWLERMIKESCPDVWFINLYDRDYPDSQYADANHFNIVGATRFTGEVIDSIRSRGVLGKGGL
jgi:hypothetical protein